MFGDASEWVNYFALKSQDQRSSALLQFRGFSCRRCRKQEARNVGHEKQSLADSAGKIRELPALSTAIEATRYLLRKCHCGSQAHESRWGVGTLAWRASSTVHSQKFAEPKGSSSLLLSVAGEIEAALEPRGINKRKAESQQDNAGSFAFKRRWFALNCERSEYFMRPVW